MINAADMKLTWRHWWIAGVASLGQLIGTMVATIAGIIIPMLNIVLHPGLSSFMQGLIAASDLLGICVGSVIIGKLSDKYGYLLFFRLCPALMCVASVVAVFVPDVWVLIICLFIVGLGVGGEYSLDSGYVSELMPKRWSSLMVGVSKTASAFGNIVAAGVSFGLLLFWADSVGDAATMWPRLMWIVAVTSGVMLLSRIYFFESPGWLMSKGRIDAAEREVKKFLGDDVEIPVPQTNPVDVQNNTPKPKSSNFFSFIRQNWRKVVLSGIPWACEGLGVYGIGVFLPILVMALGLEHYEPGEASIMHVTESVKITLYISCIILPGFLIGLFLINRTHGVTAIQTWGFLLCAVSLCLLMPAYQLHWNKWIAIGAFMAFELCLNMGPHLITYVLPPRIYTVAQRGLGVGIAASVGKIGAVVGVFIIPLLLKAGGSLLVLGVSAGVMAVGAAVTFLFRKA